MCVCVFLFNIASYVFGGLGGTFDMICRRRASFLRIFGFSFIALKNFAWENTPIPLRTKTFFVFLCWGKRRRGFVKIKNSCKRCEESKSEMGEFILTEKILFVSDGEVCWLWEFCRRRRRRLGSSKGFKHRMMTMMNVVVYDIYKSRRHTKMCVPSNLNWWYCFRFNSHRRFTATNS